MGCVECCFNRINSIDSNKVIDIDEDEPNINWIDKKIPPEGTSSSLFLNPQTYIDNNKKEWICFVKRSNIIGNHDTSSYLYDLQNDTYIPFIENFQKQLNMSKEYHFANYIIDNTNYILYMLETKNNVMIKVSFPNINSIQYIDSVALGLKQYDKFIPIPQFYQCHMGLTNNGKYIHIISIRPSAQHYVFNTKTNTLSLIDDNICKMASFDCFRGYKSVTKEQERKKRRDFYQTIFNIGDIIDARDSSYQGEYYTSEINDIKQKYQHISDDKNLNEKIRKGLISDAEIARIEKSFGIFVHYNGWPAKWDEWIYIDNNNNDNKSETICDCIGSCHTSKEYHRIAPAQTQSMLNYHYKKNDNSLDYSFVFGNDNYNLKIFKLCVVQEYDSITQNGKNIISGYNIYSRLTNDEKIKMLINGYVKTCNVFDNGDKLFYIPVELCKMIADYFGFERVTIDKYTPVDVLSLDSQKAMVKIQLSVNYYFVSCDFDDINEVQLGGKWIFIFDLEYGVSLLNLDTATVYHITNEQIFPPLIDQKCMVVVSKQSKNVHLFANGKHRCYPIHTFVNIISSNSSHNNYETIDFDKIA